MAQISSKDSTPADSELKDSGEAGSWLFSSPSSTPASTPPTTAAIAEASSSKMPSSTYVDDKDAPSAHDADENRDATILQKDANWKAPTGDGSSNKHDRDDTTSRGRAPKPPSREPPGKTQAGSGQEARAAEAQVARTLRRRGALGSRRGGGGTSTRR